MSLLNNTFPKKQWTKALSILNVALLLGLVGGKTAQAQNLGEVDIGKFIDMGAPDSQKRTIFINYIYNNDKNKKTSFQAIHSDNVPTVEQMKVIDAMQKIHNAFDSESLKRLRDIGGVFHIKITYNTENGQIRVYPVYYIGIMIDKTFINSISLFFTQDDKHYLLAGEISHADKYKIGENGAKWVPDDNEKSYDFVTIGNLPPQQESFRKTTLFTDQNMVVLTDGIKAIQFSDKDAEGLLKVQREDAKRLELIGKPLSLSPPAPPKPSPTPTPKQTPASSTTPPKAPVPF